MRRQRGKTQGPGAKGRGPRGRSPSSPRPSALGPWPSRIRTALLPPPRSRIDVRAILPLIIFLVLFLGGCFLVDAMDWVLFTRLWPFVFVLLAPWLWWLMQAGYSGLSRPRQVAALAIRFILLALFIIVLAEPRSMRKDDRLAIVFVIDVSASIPQDYIKAAQEYAIKMGHTERPAKDLAGLVYFGRDAAVQLPPRAGFPVEEVEVVNVQVDREGTDLAKALSLAAAMIPEDTSGRIILISDGVETQGALGPILDDLKSKKVEVDVLKVPYELADEVWLERLELPRFVKIGENYEAAVILSALGEGEGELVLQENGQTVFRGPVTYTAGKNRFTVPIKLRQPGYYEYKATIEQPDRQKDQFADNNVAISHLYLEGKGRVLLVTDPQGDPRDWQMMERALTQAERDVQVMSAFSMPIDPLALLPYDAIVLVNVPREHFEEPHLQAIHDAVFNQGSGLLMVGGQNSFGPGGWARTPVEQALPVDMDIKQRKVLPKGALAIVLHTCEFANGNTWAKRITKKAIQVLNPQDEVGVLVYDWQGGDKWLFKLTPAGDYENLARQIEGAQIGDMPSFVPTMQLASIELQASDAAQKHMIIISDGDPTPPPPGLINQFVNNKITISTIAINPHGGTATQTLQFIAQMTGGKYYFPQDPSKLPAIFIKEAKTLRRSAIQNKTFTPIIGPDPGGILKGVADNGLPELHGYVLVTPKARSVTTLDGPEPEQDGEDPVLTVWRYGTGTTAAFTSDLSPNWGRDWVSWDQYQSFVKQLLLHISRVQTQSSLQMRSFVSGGQGVVLIEDVAAGGNQSFLDIGAVVEGPEGQTHEVRLKQVGPTRYEGHFPLSGTGRYKVKAAAAGSDDIIHGGFVVPYSQEYLRFRANPIVLSEVANRTNGRELTDQMTGEQVYDLQRQPKISTRPVVDWLLVAMACVLVLDVGLRRVQLDWDVIRGWLRPTRVSETSDAMLGALKAKKKDVTAALRERRDEGLELLAEEEDGGKQKPARPMTLVEKARTRQAQEQARAKEKAREGDGTTTSRLLKAKKRTQDR